MYVKFKGIGDNEIFAEQWDDAGFPDQHVVRFNERNRFIAEVPDDVGEWLTSEERADYYEQVEEPSARRTAAAAEDETTSALPDGEEGEANLGAGTGSSAAAGPAAVGGVAPGGRPRTGRTGATRAR